MPPLRLTSLLQAALPQVSQPSRALLSSLACVNGSLLPANEVAAWIGLRNRFQLNRVLRRDGLPPLGELAARVRVLYWACRAEETGASLRELALHDHVQPAVAYRLVRRVTGRRWSELRRAGVDVVLSRFSTIHGSRRTRPLIAPASGTGIAPMRFPAGGPGAWAAPQHPAGVLSRRLQAPDARLSDVATTATRLALLARPRGAAIDVVELPSLASIGTIRTGPNPTRIAVTRSGERAYVTSQFGEEVGILDLRIGRQTGAIAMAGCGHPLGVVLSPDDHTLYVTTNADRLYRIDAGRPYRMTSTAIPQGSQHVAVDPAGHRVVANGWRKGVVTECDAASLRITREFQLGGCVQDLAFARCGERLYAANLAGWLDVIAYGSGTRVARIPFGTAAFGVGLSRDQRVLLVSLLYAGRVVLLDAETLRILAQVETGGRPRMIATDPGGSGVVVANENGWLDLVI